MIATPRIAEVRKYLAAARSDDETIGFVPTMGALHEGHRSLIRRAREENDRVVVSIFVNPTQFGPHEDLSKYPRTLAADLEVCAADGVDIVFHPDADEMYGDASRTRITVGRLSEPMEGHFRPGHFDGVALVCAKLFNIVGPCRAYFGEKDAQQLRVIRAMVADLFLPVEVVDCPTVRDADGLALSSRNAYLSASDRPRALALSRALRLIEDRIRAGDTRSADLVAAGQDLLTAAGVDGVDYLEISDPDTLEPLNVVNGTALVCGAVWVGDTRLIDNVLVTT